MGVTPPTSNLYKTHKMDQKNSTHRRRSFKRRRLEDILCISAAAIVFVMLQNVATIESVPMDNSGFMRIHKLAGGLHLWHHRVARDVANAAALTSTSSQSTQQQKDYGKESSSLQGSSTEITVDQQPQGQCLLDGEYVPETTVFCEKQVGCRAIQKTGHCCPDYKCDCQKDGKTYLNGDKLVDPETPCTVCYCQGGEILCSSVTCFHRDDCTPKYIPGVCCPEYDNCPVATSESSYNKTLAATSTTLKPDINHAAANNKKITIKEITKPIEIRITDDNKAIPIHQMLKPTTTTTTTTTSTTSTTSTTTTSTTAPPTQSTPTVAATNDTPTHMVDAIKDVVDSHEESLQTLSTDNNHEHNNNNKVGIVGSGDILKLTASVAYPPSTASSQTAVLANGMVSSTTGGPLDTSAEVEDPVPALSVFSTQGLPEDPSKVNIKREYFITTEGVAAAPQIYDGVGSGEYPTSELIYSGPSATAQQTLSGFQQSSAELDSDTAGSDNIYHIILTTDGPRMTTTSENYLALKGTASTEGSPFEDLSGPSSVSNDLGVSAPSTTEGPEVASTTAKDDYYAKPSTESVSHQHLDDDDSEIPIESNPAYPSLPGDDFSIRGDNNFQLSDNDDIGDEPRSIGGSTARSSYEAIKSTKRLEDVNYGSGSGSGSGMMAVEIMELSSSTEGSGGMDLSTKMANYEMKINTPEIIQFMYSAEDSSEETKITNSTDFQVDHMKKSEDTSSESVEVLKPLDVVMPNEYGSGSGAGELKQPKEREPTTARPYKGASTVDIDEIQESSGNGPEDDPKEDAESLKLDEDAQSSLVNSDKSPKGNILSVKIQTAQQEKAFEDDTNV